MVFLGHKIECCSQYSIHAILNLGATELSKDESFWIHVVGLPLYCEHMSLHSDALLVSLIKVANITDRASLLCISIQIKCSRVQTLWQLAPFPTNSPTILQLK